MMMRSGEVAAMMMGAARARAPRKVTMTTRTEARANRRLQKGGSSRKANQQRAKGKSKDKGEDQPRA